MRSCLLKDPSCDSNWFDQLQTRFLAFSFVLCVLLNLPNGPETKKVRISKIVIFFIKSTELILELLGMQYVIQILTLVQVT